jgi:hypothetical protein
VGEDRGAGVVQDVVHGRGAVGDEGLEPVQDAPLVELEQTKVGRPSRRPGHGGDLGAGEDLALVEHASQPAVATSGPRNSETVSARA